MRFFVFSKPIKLSESLLSVVESRFGFALEGFGDQVEEVRIRLCFFHREGGCIARECRARVLIDGLEDVVVAADDSDLKMAVDRAADKARDAVARALEPKLTTFHSRCPAHSRTRPVVDWSQA